jgi:hypothetical protein
MGKTRNSANLVSDNNIFIDIVNDRVGIGTTNPQYKLDVGGDINFTGTLNQNNASFVASRWTAGTGDDIYRLNGDVGIGTANPQFLADIAGDARITNTNKMRFGGTSATTNFYIQYNSTTNSLDFVAG